MDSSMLDTRIISIVIMILVLYYCHRLRVDNLRIRMFSFMTVAGLLLSWVFYSKSYYMIFQTIYLSTMLLSLPASKSNKYPMVKFAVFIAALSFIFALPFLREYRLMFYYFRNFVVYGTLITTIVDFDKNPRKLFPYIFIGTWYAASDMVKFFLASNVDMVRNLYYLVDPMANSIFHAMLLLSIIMVGKEPVTSRVYHGIKAS